MNRSSAFKPDPAGKPLDVVDVVYRSKFSQLQWWIMLLCFLIIAAGGFDTIAVGYVGRCWRRNGASPSWRWDRSSVRP